MLGLYIFQKKFRNSESFQDFKNVKNLDYFKTIRNSEHFKMLGIQNIVNLV